MEALKTVVLEKTLENPLDCKEIKVNSKGNQTWIFIGRTDAEAEAPMLWPPDVKSWLTGKDPDAGKDWGQEEKGMTEGEMVRWHHWLDGHGFAWTPGVGDEQVGLACCSSWGCKELDTTEQLNNNKEQSKNHRTDGLDSRNLFPHSSGGWKSEIKWWERLVSLTGLSP